MKRQNLADHILARLEQEQDSIIDAYSKSKDSIGHFMIDNLFPEEIAKSIFKSFPKLKSMKKRNPIIFIISVPRGQKVVFSHRKQYVFAMRFPFSGKSVILPSKSPTRPENAQFLSLF